MKTDELGQYDENEIPANLALPLKLDRINDALAGNDGQIIGRCSFSSELAQRCFDLRRADFVGRLANGEIVVSVGRVLQKTAEQWQDGQLLVTYVSDTNLRPGPIVPLSQVTGGDNGKGGVELRSDVPNSMSKSEVRKLASLQKKLGRFIVKMNEKHAPTVDAESNGHQA